MATLRFSVAETLAGSRLDRALADRDEIGTRSLAERLVRQGAVTVDGAERDKSYRLEAGSVVEVLLPEDRGGALQPEPVTVSRVYEDEHLLVVDKPAGMTVHPGAGASDGHARGATARARCGGRGRSRPAGDRPPPRSRDVRVARRRALRGGARCAPGGDPGTEGRTAVPRARPWPSALAQRADRRPARPRPARSDPEVARHERAARRRHVVRDPGAHGRACAPRGQARDRPHAPDPRSPRRDRAPGGRGPGVRRESATWVSNGSSCTRIASASCTP